MKHSEVLPAIIGFIVLEAINTVVNILPALKQTTETNRKPYFVRAGIINFVLVAGLVAYLYLKR